MMERMSFQSMLQLQRWNTPSVYNGWEAITKHDRTTCFNRESLHDYMSEMGPMVGYAVTLVIEPSNKKHPEQNLNAIAEYRRYVASIPGPKIVVVQDLDKPYAVGSFWGEVNANTHRALGCVGTITDGAIRDLDEMKAAGFKAIARDLCVGHAYNYPVRWNCDVEVFGCPIKPGQLIHADKHGFLVIPEEDEAALLEATAFLDKNECQTVIAAAKASNGLKTEELLAALEAAGRQYAKNSKSRFNAEGEWK